MRKGKPDPAALMDEVSTNPKPPNQTKIKNGLKAQVCS